MHRYKDGLWSSYSLVVTLDSHLYGRRADMPISRCNKFQDSNFQIKPCRVWEVEDNAEKAPKNGNVKLGLCEMANNE